VSRLITEYEKLKLQLSFLHLFSVYEGDYYFFFRSSYISSIKVQEIGVFKVLEKMITRFFVSKEGDLVNYAIDKVSVLLSLMHRFHSKNGA